MTWPFIIAGLYLGATRNPWTDAFWLGLVTGTLFALAAANMTFMLPPHEVTPLAVGIQFVGGLVSGFLLSLITFAIGRAARTAFPLVSKVATWLRNT